MTINLERDCFNSTVPIRLSPTEIPNLFLFVTLRHLLLILRIGSWLQVSFQQILFLSREQERSVSH